jgi:hypothetical protein
MPPPDKRPTPSPQHRRGTPPPPIVAYEDVVAACGHPEKFGLFEDRKDRYRNDRRKKVTDRPCRACRERKRQEEEVAIEARKAERQQRAAAEAARGGQSRKRSGPPQARLPDGSKFEVVYSAERTQWAGTLTIGEQVFTGSAGALFTLLNRLDRQYRDTLPKPEGSEEGTD